MPTANGHGPKTAVLYARVSTDEQARSGYSLAQQIEALRAYAAREGYEVLEEVSDPGQSGASLERPGMDRVRDLVAAGGVSVVLAQDRDRFAREPAYLYLLRQEFAGRGTALRALNDRGDESPEGELTDGILDQLAKFQRAQIARNSRRGKLQKAREGKVIATTVPDYGFGYNAARDGYVVDEAAMAVVRRIFRMVGAEGKTAHAVKAAFDREGVPSPGGAAYWNKTFVRECILDDVYRPHAFEEVEALVSADVAARLDPRKRYGIWWFNRRRQRRTQVSENGTGGRTYRRRTTTVMKPREEWIAVPVPESGVPREWVDAARAAIKDNRRPSNAGRRSWELSGGIMRCGDCGHALVSHTVAGGGGAYFYYACRTRYRKGRDACSRPLNLPARRLEGRIWETVSGILKDPDRLRGDLDAMIELERSSKRGDPGEETRLWADRLAEAGRKRARYQEMAAADLITLDELRSALAQLDQARETAAREIAALRDHEEHVRGLEQDRDALLGSLEEAAPDALDSLTPEERRRFYQILRLRVVANHDGSLEASGAFDSELSFCDNGIERPRL